MNRKLTRTALVPLVVFLLGLALVIPACGGGDEPAGSAGDKMPSTAYVVGPVCKGTALPDAPSYSQASGTHSLAILKLGDDGDYRYGFIDPNSYSLPEGWRANYVEDLELVVCVDKEENALVEKCKYTLEDGSGTVTLSRYSTQVTFRLVEAQTGREIAADTLVGMPRECPETQKFLKGTAGSSIVGKVYEELEDWLRPYVEIP